MNRPETLQGQYAGCFSRLLAFVIDLVVVSLLVFGTTWLATNLFGLFDINILQCTRTWCEIVRAAIVATSMAIPLLYFIVLWVLNGQTIGMAVMGVRVVRLRGGNVNVIVAVSRLFGYFITLITLGIGFFWTVLDARRQALHDKLAGTVVIYSWEAQLNQKTIERLRHALQRRREGKGKSLASAKHAEAEAGNPEKDAPSP